MMDDTAAALTKALRAAGVAVVGVTIGALGDKTTWKVQPPELQAAAQPHIDSFTRTDADRLQDRAVSDIDDKKLRALARALYECIPNPTMTLAQLRARAIDIYKSL